MCLIVNSRVLINATQNNMNRHNFRQFNPNCYKKHLSPFGRNVLDTLIKHWRTGFDNSESRRRHQLISSNNRRNTRECYGISHPIPSVPSSPESRVYDDRGIYQTTNGANNDPEPEIQKHQDFQVPILYDADCLFHQEKDTYNAHFDDNNFAKPRPVRSTLERSTPVSTHYEKYLHQANHDTKSNLLLQRQDTHEQRQHLCEVLPNKPMFSIDTHSDLPNETGLTTDDLAKTFEIANTNEEEVLTANDMITPVINFDNVNESLLSSTKKRSDTITDPDMPTKKFLEILNQDTKDKTYPTRNELIINGEEATIKNVDWDDIFDTELFLDLKTPQQLMLPLENDKDNKFRIVFPKDNKESKQNNLLNKVIKRKTKNTNNISKNMNEVTGKHNNASEETPKINFRKMKYTKAVKNWLDHIDPNNHIEDVIGVPINDATDMVKQKVTVMQDSNVGKSNVGEKSSTIASKDVVALILNKPEEMIENENTTFKILPHAEKIINADEINESKTTVHNETAKAKHSKNSSAIEKKPKNKNKKIIQTMLAKKDGKMKFGPPVKGQIESITNVTVDNEPKSKETKEKKGKAKFVPPIKSQIPVKNVLFDVIKIDESNVHLIYNMIRSNDNDIAMIIIYSNGFCQLNNHHTEDTSVPEGVMIQSHDKFFYIKHNEQDCDLMRMTQLLEKSHVICYNGKRLLIYLSTKYVLELNQDSFNLSDAKIGASLIDPDNPPENFAELQKLLDFTPEFTIATECVLQKAAWYITLLRECFDKLKVLLLENSVWNVFVAIEMPLLPVIADMEYLGVCVDQEKLKSMEDILLTKMKAVEQECYKAAGKTFQINSTLQVRTILYDELQLDTKSNLKIKETIGKGAKSTSETMLRGLVSVHPLPRLILEYRHLHKAHATFVTGIAQHVKDGMVKPTWEQMAAATGRIASNNPNLQAIPKAPFSLVVFPEKSEEYEPTLNFRSVYTARPQHLFLAADFKHIECRVFAHAADDATLQDALQSGQDLFKVLAAKWLNKPVAAVSTEDRERTKRIVYASLYGAGARKLMEILHVGYEQALSVASSFNRTFPALKSFGREVVSRATRGELRTLCGRARRSPHISSADAALRAQAERQAVNFVVQGSAADLCKMAMVAVQRRLPGAARGRLVLQIHDELVWELADGDVAAAAAIIKETMENVGRDRGMDMALPVELTVGPNWGEMQAFPPQNTITFN